MGQKLGLIKIRNTDMRDLIEYAKGLGYEAVQSKGGHIKFTRPGLQPTFTASTPSDPRSWKNCKARLKRQVELMAA